MKKRVSRYSKKKNRILNKIGMTYVELLCALSLLSLIVVMFTPMLLSSYDQLYKAGEKVESVYESKKDLEEGLATRFSETTIVFENFHLGLNNIETNADMLFNAVNVNGKKVVSSLQQGLETVFGFARASIDIISPRVVYDNQTNHDVMIQTRGLEYSNVYFGSYADKYGTNQEKADEAFIKAHKENINAGGEGIIFIEVIVPDKSLGVKSGTTTEEAIYHKSNIANIQMYDVNNLKVLSSTAPNTSGSFEMLNTQNDGRIKFNVTGRKDIPLDFTQSPIKISVYYVTPRNQVRVASDYLTIEPPTMIFAGDTNSSVDYYTSAGITEDGGTYSFKVMPRKMRIANSGYLTANDTPGSKGVRIQTVTWVQEDENDKLNPYYVMAGTNSSVYRMYNYSTHTSIDDVFGFATGTAPNTIDGSCLLFDGSAANPSFWSGEMSDQYYFKTLTHSSGYGTGGYIGTDCSQAQSGKYDGGSRNHVGTQYNAFDKSLRYVMMFNGFSTGYDYQHLANRRISYVLTEVGGGHSFRLGGKLGEDGEFDGYSLPWEPEGAYYMGKGLGLHFGKKPWPNEDEYYDYDNMLIGDRRIVGGVSDKNSPLYAWQEGPYDGPAYFQGKSSGGENEHWDRNFAYVRIKSSVSVDALTSTINKDSDYKYFEENGFWCYKGDDEELGGVSTNDKNWLATEHSKSVNVTSSVFLPGAGSKGQGQVIYFGTVPAYAFLRQSSDIGDNSDVALHVYNGKNVKDSRATAYVIYGTNNDTTIYRAYAPDANNTAAASDMFKKVCLKLGGHEQNDYILNTDGWDKKKGDFYTYIGSGKEVLGYTDTDLRFTFGYCSRWRMAIGDVTSNGVSESPRSYEKYYWASNPTAKYKIDRVKHNVEDITHKINNQGEDNLYYNVWFPGEYYNLTHTATLDELTVAVGYAVSGSTFMKESAAWKEYGKSGGFYGTALGSIYNDAVMAAYVSEDAGGTVYRDGLAGKGDQNAIFQNVLYYKMHSFISDASCPWYLHARDSVRFTAVDLFAHTSQPVQNGNTLTSSKEYYAVYGDSNGKAYYSRIAESTITGTLEEDTATESNLVVRSGNNPLYSSDMNEIKLSTGASLSTIYSEVTNIDCAENICIIAGRAKNKDTVEQLIIATKDDEENNIWSFKSVYNGTFKGEINNAMILGNYYYIVGDGWVAGVALDTLRNLPDGGTITNKTESLTASPDITGTSNNKDHLLWVKTNTNIYALSGRLTDD